MFLLDWVVTRATEEKCRQTFQSGGILFVGRGSGRDEVDCGHLAGLPALQLVGQLLSFAEIAHSGALGGGNVDEHVRRAILRLNETETFDGIEPFNSASGHDVSYVWRCLE
jgi:hypothetical protein